MNDYSAYFRNYIRTQLKDRVTAISSQAILADISEQEVKQAMRKEIWQMVLDGELEVKHLNNYLTKPGSADHPFINVYRLKP